MSRIAHNEGSSVDRVVAADRVRSALAGRHIRAKARVTRKPGVMNKLEARYSRHLDLLRLGGEVHAWKFEAITLKLAEKCRYNPDFVVILQSGEIECHETKGFRRDDAIVKLKVAASTFPWFVFRLVTWDGGAWKIEEIEA